MADVNQTGPTNIDSNVALASGSAVVTQANGINRVQWISLSPISTASGVQCGFIELRVVATVLGRWYHFFTASAAGQSDTLHIPLDITIKTGTLRITYTAVTDATTAAVAIGWANS